MKSLWIAAPLVVSLLGCASITRPPLDPGTAASGGRLTPQQLATDVLQYDLTLEVFPETMSIEGRNVSLLRALEPLDSIELQLDAGLVVNRVSVEGRETPFERDGGRLVVSLPASISAGDEVAVAIDYGGQPHVAVRAPWDGGFVWSHTETGEPWIATAVQGSGCDLWWPCKDHFADKPDRMEMHVTVPPGLSVALNGVLQSIDTQPDGRLTFHWRLGVPISDYNVSLNIGPFERIETSYEAINGVQVPIEFWALEAHADEVRQMIDEDLRDQVSWFEERLGPYPWGGEKLGFVETPHLGMEHQTLNAYGNKFRRDAHGFDWLLHHELAHEWFGNLMTHAKSRDAWLHEGFGAYMQSAYSLDRDGEAAYLHRLYKSYLGMKNCTPVVQEGDPNSDEAFTGDIYVKGAWLLHTLRWLIGEDPFWNATRRLLYDTPQPWDLGYPIPPIYRSSEDFATIAAQEANRDLEWLFDVYLREADLPTLIVEREADRLDLHWEVPGDRPFPMPVPVRIDGTTTRIGMESGRESIEVPAEARLIVDPEMRVLRQLPIIATCEEARAED